MTRAKQRDDTGLAPNDVRGRQALRMLRDLGPMITKEFAMEADISVNLASKALRRLCRKGAVHICEWRHEPREVGVGVFPRAVYALGPGRHAPKPKPRPGNVMQVTRLRRYKALLVHTYPNITQKAAQKLLAQARRNT